MMIELKNISKIYGDGDSKVCALDNVSVTINEGELVSIIGPSGSGKSTLMNIIGLMDRFDLGEYKLDEKLLDIERLTSLELGKLRNSMFGFVYQNFALLDGYTVIENIEMPIIIKGRLNKEKINKKDEREKIIKLIEEFGLKGKENKMPTQLSGGQQQRVAILRAIINNSPIILADEPTGALDSESGQFVFDQLIKLKNEGKMVIIVTHNEDIANKCDRIIKIVDGKIYTN